MPRTLHAELARVAEREGVSLNQLITGALASSVSWRDGSRSEGGAEDRGWRSRLVPLALVANLVVVAIAAVIAVALLVVAWQAR